MLCRAKELLGGPAGGRLAAVRGDERVSLLNELYESLELYPNFFQPSMKLKSKERIGARVRKKYHPARTPYRRVLESGHVSKEIKRQLKQRYESLNPAQLKINEKQKQNNTCQTSPLGKHLTPQAKPSPSLHPSYPA